MRGALRLGNGEVAIDDVEGTLAGGRASGQLVLRRGGDGLEARGRFALANADASAVLPSEGKPVVTGRIGLQAEFEGSGLSAASLIGSLKGAGTITLEDAQISGLDPKAFNAAIRAADQAAAVDAREDPRHRRDRARRRRACGAAARCAVRAQRRAGARRPDHGATGRAPISSSRRARISPRTSLDARLTLIGPAIAEGSATTRPEILVLLKGPAGAPKRTVDVSTLSGFLMLRSVERQARQIDTIEAERREAERREAERREANGKRSARRTQEAERREAAARAVAAPAPAALPAPQIPEDVAPPPIMVPERQTRPRPAAPPVRTPPAAERAPALPPPLNIGPAPGAGKSTQTPRPPGEAAAKGAQPQTAAPPPPRSALDILFGVQR